MQNAELNEAERLEREAAGRRANANAYATGAGTGGLGPASGAGPNSSAY